MNSFATMSLTSDGTEVDESWKVDLEIALLEDADFFRVRSICANRPIPANLRPDVWRLCLHPETQLQAMSSFDDVFGLDNQTLLHEECELAASQIYQHLIEDLSKKKSSEVVGFTLHSDEEEDKVDICIDNLNNDCEIPSVTKIASDFESVLTHFSRTYALNYSSNNGWISILKVLYRVLKPADRCELYACFISFYHRFVATGFNVEECVCIVFRLLLQYHEPKLCSFLDSLKLGPEIYITSWLSSLFADAVSEQVIPSLWDIYFLISDPFLGFFIGLLLLVNAKPALLSEDDDSSGTNDGDNANEVKLEESSARNLNVDQIRKLLIDLPQPMQVEDLGSLIELTEVFSRRTPISFRSQYLPLLFGNLQPEPNGHLLSGTLCMPVTIQEVLEAQSTHLKDFAIGNIKYPEFPVGSVPELRFLVVDCRPADQYNAGHLPTAFFLDSTLLLTEPAQFQSSVKSLLATQQRAIAAESYAAGEHIALMGSGKNHEDELINMVVAAFLRLHTPYVSLIDGGYSALHEVIGPLELGRSLLDHNPQLCDCCRLTSQHPKLLPSSSVKLTSDSPTHKSQSPTLIQTSQSNLIKLAPKTDIIRPIVGGLFSKFSTSVFKRTTPVSAAAAPGGATAPAAVKQQTSKSNNNPTTKSDPSQPDVDNPTNSKQTVFYRNTSAVFTIDDEFDDTDSYTLGEDYPNVPAPTTELVEVKPIQSVQPKDSWIKRLAKLPLPQPDETPEGDCPPRPGGLDSSEPGDLIDTTQWSQRPEIRGVFPCQFVSRTGQLTESGFLAVTERHLVLIRNRLPDYSTQILSSLTSTFQSVFAKKSTTPVEKSPTILRHGVVVRCAPIKLISRITSNKRVPECITFQYTAEDDAQLLLLNEQVLGLRDRLFIPEAGEAVRMVKLAFYNAFSSP